MGNCRDCTMLRSEVRKMRDELREHLPPCPDCGERTFGWIAPSGSFAPEAWATLRDKGIDPATGHKNGCFRRRR